MGFPGSSDGKALACKTGDPGSIPGLKRSPGEGNGYPLWQESPVFLSGEFHEQIALHRLEHPERFTELHREEKREKGDRGDQEDMGGW